MSSTFFLIVLVGLSAAVSRSEPGSIDLIRSQSPSGELAGWEWFCEDPTVPVSQVWKLTDDGVLVCTGKPLGYLYTKKKYTDFVLRFQWRWPAGKPGRGGVLLRTTGEHRIWPTSLEAQINSGDAGDFWGLNGYRLNGPEERKKVIEHPRFGTLTNLRKTAAVEKPPGQWNTYEITVRGDVVVLVINGHEVNRATGCTVVPGVICLTAEGDEIHFRSLRLVPLDSSNE